jgi:predicted RNA binding protein YcfA (HicA-like mRNA interferase family)
MPRKIRELRRDLRHSGWYIERQTGSHQRWKHALVPDYQVTLAGADGSDAKPYDAKPYMEDGVREALARAVAAKMHQQKGQQP